MADALNAEGVTTLEPKSSVRWHANAVRIAPETADRPNGLRLERALGLVVRVQHHHLRRYAVGGWSYRRLADALNAEGVPALGPRPGAGTRQQSVSPCRQRRNA